MSTSATHVEAGAGGLRAQPGWPAYLLAATLARLASEMFAVAVVLLVLERTGRPGLAGAAVAASTLPSVVTGPVLGAWLDRTARRRAVLASNQVVLGTSLLAILATAGRTPGWVLLLLAALAGLTAPLATGGFTSMIPSLVPERLLQGANALEAASFNTAAIAGPALAGAVAAGLGATAAVAAEAAIAGLALLAVARLPRIGVVAARAATSMTATIRQGLWHLARTPVLRGVTVATAVALGGLGLLTLALPFLAERLGAGRAGAGFLWAALEAGAAAGALAAARPLAGWPPQRVVLGGLALLGLAMAAWPLAPSFPVALLLVLLAGVAEGPAFAATFATRQRFTPADLRGQIFTTAASLKVGAFAVGAALAGPAVGQLGVGTTLAVAGAVHVLAALLGVAAGATLRSAAHPTQAPEGASHPDGTAAGASPPAAGTHPNPPPAGGAHPGPAR